MGELPPLRAAAERMGSVDFSQLWSGQGVALCAAMPAEMLMQVLVQEAIACLKQLAAKSQPVASRRGAATA
jgi:nitronate monooxygenase